MGVTIGGLEAMGFKALGQGESVQGTFTRVDVFAIRGFTIDAPCLPPFEESINGVPFKLGIGNSINEVCKLLTGDVYADDVEQWKKDTKSTPPFMLLSFGPTGEYVSSGTHAKADGERIETYDSFREAKKELKEQSDAVVPLLLTSLSLTFSSEGRRVRFLPIQSDVAGKSFDGKTIYDFRFEFAATGFASSRINAEQVTLNVALSIKNSKTLNRDITQFFYNGSNEKDPLKRFLYFFLFVERLVHVTYKAVDHQAAISSLMSRHAHVAEYAKKLLGAHRQSWTDLHNRFVWCVMHKWTHLADLDVKEFDHLKEVRDHISHGELSAPDGADVTAIEALARRIQGNS